MKTTADTKAVTEYTIRYAQTRGAFPRLVVGMMRELAGWPVRDASGGGNLGHFDTEAAAESAIRAAKAAYRATFGVEWFQ